LRLISDGVSEATRRVHDEETRALADEAFRGALAIVARHRAELDELAATLLTNEVLEREDIDRVMQGVPKAAPPRIGRGELGIAAATAVEPKPRD
jgi:ATP-dependent Zn protease